MVMFDVNNNIDNFDASFASAFGNPLQTTRQGNVDKDEVRKNDKLTLALEDYNKMEKALADERVQMLNDLKSNQHSNQNLHIRHATPLKSNLYFHEIGCIQNPTIYICLSCQKHHYNVKDHDRECPMSRVIIIFPRWPSE